MDRLYRKIRYSFSIKYKIIIKKKGGERILEKIDKSAGLVWLLLPMLVLRWEIFGLDHLLSSPLLTSSSLALLFFLSLLLVLLRPEREREGKALFG